MTAQKALPGRPTSDVLPGVGVALGAGAGAAVAGASGIAVGMALGAAIGIVIGAVVWLRARDTGQSGRR